MYCRHCGIQLPDAVKYCNECGGPVQDVSEPRLARGAPKPAWGIAITAAVLVLAVVGMVLTSLHGQAPTPPTTTVRGEPELIAPRTSDPTRATETCLSNVKQIALAALMYAQDHDGNLAPASNWTDALLPYVKNRDIFHCPADGRQWSYALNSSVAGLNVNRMDRPQEAILVFESSTARWNASDPLTSLCSPPRHKGRNAVAYCDGHAAFLPEP